MLSLEFKILYVLVLVIISIGIFKKIAIIFWSALTFPLLSIAFDFPVLITAAIAGATIAALLALFSTDENGMLFAKEIEQMDNKYNILLMKWKLNHYIVIILSYILTISISMIVSEYSQFTIEASGYSRRLVISATILSFMISSMFFMAIFLKNVKK